MSKDINKTTIATGTLEWATKNANFITGCPRDCKYCFSKALSVFSGRRKPNDWKREEVRQHDLNKKVKKVEGKVMFPSSHDITQENLNNSIVFLKKYIDEGNNMLIVSKPNLSVITALCEEFKDFKDQILFRFSIGSCNQNVLNYWEHNAPSYEERKACLVYAFEKGFKTSVSAEPFLDNDVLSLVKELQEFITDSIWIGKANRLKFHLSINGHKDVETMKMADELLKIYSDENIFKIYNQLKDYPKIKWKESIKKVVGIELLTKIGLDI